MANDLNGIFTLKEFYNRGVTKLAPDVLVYIGGSLTTTVIAPVSSNNGNLSFNDGITTVSVQNNVDPPGSSSANIEIVTPIYGPNSKYWALFPGPDPNDPNSNPVRAPLFSPMMEVKIYFKGRYLVNGQPKYYPSFWGFIVNVDESYSGGVYKIGLVCADMLHWLHYSTLNVHPDVATNQVAGGNLDLSVWGTTFNTSNPYQIIYSLIVLMGWDSFVVPSWVAQKTAPDSIWPVNPFDQAPGIMNYWKQRFATMGNLLKLYGINGKQVDKNGIQTRQPEVNVMNTGGDSYVGQGVAPKDSNQYTIDGGFLREFSVFGDLGQMGQFENSEYMTKLDIATNVKTRSDFEFFQDVNGNFVFKPPFYNMNVKGLLPYTLLPSDIISYSVNQDTEGIVTSMTVLTPMDPLFKYLTFGQGVGFFMDVNLTKRFGVRHVEHRMEYIKDGNMAKAFAVGQMTLINAKTLTGTVTIPGRPEMRLGYPVYIEHRDSFHYVKAINHSFDYGGSFVTTLSLETERKKVYNLDNLFNSPAQKGSPYIDTVFRLDKSAPTPTDSNSIVQSNPKDVLRESLLRSENRIVSSDPGGYVISSRATDQELSTTTTTIPYTDGDGYQLIGGFPYGRNLDPVLISSETVGPPIFKDVYLTTMARPLYQSESDAMGTLFFDNQEGAVPAYLNTGSETPRILGTIDVIDPTAVSNLETIFTPAQAAISNNDRLADTVSTGVNNTMVNMKDGVQNVPFSGENRITSDLGYSFNFGK